MQGDNEIRQISIQREAFHCSFSNEKELEEATRVPL